MFKQQLRLRSQYQTGTDAWKDSCADNDGILLGYALGWGRFETPYGFVEMATVCSL